MGSRFTRRRFLTALGAGAAYLALTNTVGSRPRLRLLPHHLHKRRARRQPAPLYPQYLDRKRTLPARRRVLQGLSLPMERAPHRRASRGGRERTRGQAQALRKLERRNGGSHLGGARRSTPKPTRVSGIGGPGTVSRRPCWCKPPIRTLLRGLKTGLANLSAPAHL
jgi:hypothetical protein